MSAPASSDLKEDVVPSLLQNPEVKDLVAFSEKHGLREFPTELTLGDGTRFLCHAYLQSDASWLASIDNDTVKVGWKQRRTRAAKLLTQRSASAE